MEYDLSRMNGSSFERLIRGLSFASFGQSGTVYSSGADGARDFTIEGVIKGYESRGWDGYLVVQAKCKESPGGLGDIDWLKSQISAEVKKFKQNNLLKRPVYYIIATNIKLSGADGIVRSNSTKATKGGLTKIQEYASILKTEIGVKDFDIWPADKISDLLNLHDSVRRSFRGWVTPGDVLSKVLAELDHLTPEFKTVISRSLKINLEHDQYVRLRDAGSVEDVRIRTSQVFVDLPLAGGRLDPLTGDIIQEFCIAKLLDRATDKLDAETVTADDKSNKKPRPRSNRVVVIGGPGQGKSTATLFFTQILRSHFIAADPTSKRNDNVKNLYPEIINRAKHEGINSQIAFRYPMHILLPRYADLLSRAKLSDKKPPSLLAYIAQELSGASDDRIAITDIRQWLAAYPWALILDGLDEVPPSGERPLLLEAINNFFTEVAEINADVLVVVTTRPQGFNKDLNSELWEYWTLAELNKAQALNYARAFGQARYPLDKRRREDVLLQLEDATTKPTTSRLLVSPLQVTILHFIVDTGGGVPAARWTLFNEYFETLKKREKAKGGRTKIIIEKYWSQLGPIHHRAGLVLQADSEHGGNAASKFTKERFEELVKLYLLSEGFTPIDVSGSVKEIMELALHRLVLLSAQEEHLISFDVRSLQEYMAAAAITSSDQPTMERRLSFIAGRAHWRHVFLIAASRCFSDDSFHYRRSIIVNIPRQVDAVKPDSLTRNGCRLALDLVADGIGVEHPLSRRPLLYHALELLDLGPSSFDLRLSTIWDESNVDILQDFLERRMSKKLSPVMSAGWKLLFNMHSTLPLWSERFIASHWPHDPTVAIDNLSHIQSKINSSVIYNLVVQTLQSAGCSLVLKHFSRRNDHFISQFQDLSEEQTDRLHALTMSYDYYVRDSQYMSVDLSSSQGDLSIGVMKLGDGFKYNAFTEVGINESAWGPMIAVAKAAGTLSELSVAEALEALSKFDDELLRTVVYYLPWIFGGIISETGGAKGLVEVATEIRDGQRGTVSEWLAAEDRWSKEGVNEADIRSSVLMGKWVYKSMYKIGLPPLLLSRITSSNSNGNLATEISTLIEGHESNIVGDKLVYIIAFILNPFAGRPTFTNIDQARRMFEKIPATKSGRFYGDILLTIPADLLEDPGFRSVIEALAFNAGPATPKEALSDYVNLYNKTGVAWILRFVVYGMVRHSADQIQEASRRVVTTGFFGQQNIVIRDFQNVILAASGPGSTDVNTLVEIYGRTDDSALKQVVLHLLSLELFTLEQRIEALSQISEKEQNAFPVYGVTCLDNLRTALDARPSNIVLRQHWNDDLLLYKDVYQVLLPKP